MPRWWGRSRQGNLHIRSRCGTAVNGAALLLSGAARAAALLPEVKDVSVHKLSRIVLSEKRARYLCVVAGALHLLSCMALARHGWTVGTDPAEQKSVVRSSQ